MRVDMLESKTPRSDDDGPRSHGWRFATILVLQLAYTASLLVFGVIAGSLVLLSEGIHSTADLFASGLTVFLYCKKGQPGSAARPFGLKRASTIGGLFSSVFLLASCIFILVEGLERYLSPEHSREVASVYVVYLGIAGVSLNCIHLCLMCCGFRFHEHGHSHAHGHSHSHGSRGEAEHDHDHATGGDQRTVHDLNTKGMVLHFMADAASSLLVLCSGLIASYTTWSWRGSSDAIASGLIVIVIIVIAVPLLRESTEILLQTPPPAVVESLRSGELARRVRACVDAANRAALEEAQAQAGAGSAAGMRRGLTAGLASSSSVFTGAVLESSLDLRVSRLSESESVAAVAFVIVPPPNADLLPAAPTAGPPVDWHNNVVTRVHAELRLLVDGKLAHCAVEVRYKLQ